MNKKGQARLKLLFCKKMINDKASPSLSNRLANKIRFIFGIVIVLLMAIHTANAEDLKSKKSKNNSELPLEVPELLKSSIASLYPGFRIPNQKDMVKQWGGQARAGIFDFIEWGDFNGDGLTDVALILLSDTKSKLTILHQGKDGYVSAYEDDAPIDNEHVPQSYYIDLVKKGRTLHLEECTEEGCKPITITPENDCIMTGQYEASGSIMCYSADGEYRDVWVSGDL